MKMYDTPEAALQRAREDLTKSPEALLEEMYHLVHTPLIREDEHAPHHASAKFAALLVRLAEQAAKESAENIKLQKAVKILTVFIFILTIAMTVLAFLQVKAAYNPLQPRPQSEQKP